MTDAREELERMLELFNNRDELVRGIMGWHQRHQAPAKEQRQKVGPNLIGVHWTKDGKRIESLRIHFEWPLESDLGHEVIDAIHKAVAGCGAVSPEVAAGERSYPCGESKVWACSGCGSFGNDGETIHCGKPVRKPSDLDWGKPTPEKPAEAWCEHQKPPHYLFQTRWKFCPICAAPRPAASQREDEVSITAKALIAFGHDYDTMARWVLSRETAARGGEGEK